MRASKGKQEAIIRRVMAFFNVHGPSGLAG